MSKHSVFSSGFWEQRKTIESLIEESRTDADFYLFLSFSAFITTLGLHLNNPVVIVGAMLIAPLLFPLLALGMGVVTSSAKSVHRSLVILGKSVLGVVGISFITSFLLNQREVTEQIILASNPNILFFFIAVFSGVVASYSWVKQSLSSTLPGIAITVSLIPPLSTVGIALSLFSRELFAGSIMLFVINLIGIVFASILIFSLFGFAALQRVQEKTLEEEKEKVEEMEESEEGSLLHDNT